LITISAPPGGTVSNAEETASVEILPGALLKETQITINPLPEASYGDFLIQNRESITSTEVHELSLSVGQTQIIYLMRGKVGIES